MIMVLVKRVGGILTYGRRLSTLVLDFRNLASFMYRQGKTAIDAPGCDYSHFLMASYVMTIVFFVMTMARLYRCYIHIGVGSVRCSFDGTGQCESLESRMTTRGSRFFCVHTERMVQKIMV